MEEVIVYDENIKAKKKCLCVLCEGFIQKGEEYNTVRTVCDEEDFSYYEYHLHCKELIFMLDMDCSDEISPDDFWERLLDSLCEEIKLPRLAKLVFDEIKQEEKR